MKKMKFLHLLALMIYSASVFSQTDTIKGEFYNGLALVNYGGKENGHFILGGKFGFINHNNEKIIPLIYDFALDFNNGFAMVCNGVKISADSSELESFGLCGIIDSTGKIVVPILYDIIERIEQEDLTNKVILAVKDKKVGWIDFNGNVKIPFIYDDGKHEYTGNLFRVKKGTKWGYIDINGNEIIPFIYDKVGRFHNGHAICIKDGKEILIDLPVDLIKSKSEESSTNNAKSILKVPFSKFEGNWKLGNSELKIQNCKKDEIPIRDYTELKDKNALRYTGRFVNDSEIEKYFIINIENSTEYGIGFVDLKGDSLIFIPDAYLKIDENGNLVLTERNGQINLLSKI
jgi:hypothetical protein